MISFIDKVLEIDKNISYSGLTYDTNVMLISRLFEKNDHDLLVLVNSIVDANKLYEKIRIYTDEVYIFPMDDFIASVAISVSPELKIKRLETLRAINSPNKKIIITNLMGYLQFLPNKEKNITKLQLSKDLNFKREKLIETLDNFGYTKTSLVTTTGEYATRGFIIDVFGIEMDNPIRIEYFGDTIESIREFDDVTQLSINNIESVELYTFKEQTFDKNSNIFEYLNQPSLIIIDKNQINNSYEKLLSDVESYKEKKEIEKDTKYFRDLIYPDKDKVIEIDFINKKADNKIINQEIENFNSDIEKFNNFVYKNIKNNNTVIFFLSNDSQINYIKSKIDYASIINDYNQIDQKKLNIIKKKISKGFILGNYVIIAETDFEKTKYEKINYQSSLKIGKRISSFDQINIGDYIVHRIHGIGIYNGVVTIEKNHLKMDYIQLLYKGNDKVYIPIEKINTLFKYTVKDGHAPTINKLNSIEWEKKKLKVKDKINDISDELIELYAERNKSKKNPFITYEDEIIFANEFIYEPTLDQLKAIEEINRDLISTKPMDRLLCGDVGYGKTEVAFRTIFKAILNGYQVAYLCPTTILSNQQYQSAVERFKNFPINIALLNRFTSTKNAQKICHELESGKIDLVIGTHKLLNDKIKYKNLNLLIVDEEQRFGVLHKEKIKSMKANINILTLSATPIPRTLKMAMSGIRDLSIIDTPPVNRYPVQTYVIEEEELVIKDVIYKEISRNGQCFILYNRVANIEEEAYKISQLVPEAKVICAHGQMNKNELESIMKDFISEKYNVLVCTTIIEAGIDIPNVNTLVVIDADKFGLSQLYQIRGRVGRSDRVAYAYLMYNRTKILTESAIKRLKSIQEFTELGSGYKIAMRDLAIRGSGDILGSEQAGFIETVGIELYMQMINEKMQELAGNKAIEETETKNLVDVETHIPDSFVTDESIKIEVHKKINEIVNKEDLIRIKSELEDRFGELTENLLIYMYQRLFEELAKRNGITQLNKYENIIELIIPKDKVLKIDGEKLLTQISKINSSILVRYHNNRIIITLLISRLSKHYIYYLVDIVELLDNNIVKKEN